MFLLVAFIAATTLVNAQEIKKLKAADIVKMLNTTNHPVVINFWTTWCGPCINELKYFEKTINEFKDKNVELVLISLDYPEDYNKIAPFVTKKGYKATVYWLDEQVTSVIQTTIDKGFEGNIPFSIFYNKATKYRTTHNGLITEKELKKELETKNL